MNIPKVIHYCWFGKNPLPKIAKKCIASWKKYCPDYQIIEWNEENFDINMNEYTKMCYEDKKYAFLSDYVRLYVVEKYGGLYFDTDVEVVKAYDDLLGLKGFLGFENNEFVATGLGFGAEPGNIIIKKMLEEYEQLLDGKNGVIKCPTLNTNALVKLGLKLNGENQIINGVHIYSMEYFNPYNDLTGVLRKTKNTYSIHWYNKSWLKKSVVLRSHLTRPLHRIFGIDFFRR